MAGFYPPEEKAKSDAEIVGSIFDRTSERLRSAERGIKGLRSDFDQFLRDAGAADFVYGLNRKESLKNRQEVTEQLDRHKGKIDEIVGFANDMTRTFTSIRSIMFVLALISFGSLAASGILALELNDTRIKLENVDRVNAGQIRSLRNAMPTTSTRKEVGDGI